MTNEKFVLYCFGDGREHGKSDPFPSPVGACKSGIPLKKTRKKEKSMKEKFIKVLRYFKLDGLLLGLFEKLRLGLIKKLAAVKALLVRFLHREPTRNG